MASFSDFSNSYSMISSHPWTYLSRKIDLKINFLDNFLENPQEKGENKKEKEEYLKRAFKAFLIDC